MTIDLYYLRTEIVVSGHCLHVVAKFMGSFKQTFFPRGFDMFVFGPLGSTYCEDKSFRLFFFPFLSTYEFFLRPIGSDYTIQMTYVFFYHMSFLRTLYDSDY